ncbi:hypothetical protein [Nonomuraea sp. NPDC049709]|uniref:hypothetical protein n=1 Tax=Nonomuraea sp. NPDC049709 TaxID=3154736 RepID=UPI00341B150E
MTVTGIDFVALRVRDLAGAAEFYETRLGSAARHGRGALAPGRRRAAAARRAAGGGT